MKKSLIYMTWAAVWLSACHESVMDEPIDSLSDSQLYAVAASFQMERAESRTDILISPDSVRFRWNETDTLGVFPTNGYQTAFWLNAASERPSDLKAIFDGGQWLLRQNASYAAYYPFSGEAYDLTSSTLIARYPTELQQGNNRTTHLPKYDYMACPFQTVSPTSGVDFTMVHLGSLMQINIKAPAADNWHYFRLKGADQEFIREATYDLSESQPKLHCVETSDTFRIDMSGISTTAQGEVFTIYTMVASNPDATPTEWSITLKGDGGIYRDTIRNTVDKVFVKYLKPGSCYARAVNFDGTSSDDWTIPVNDDGSYDPSKPILSPGPGTIGIRATTYEWDDEVSSRMQVTNTSTMEFSWSRDDVLGIFPEADNQTAFSLSSQAGKKLALFDGNDWALRPNCKYAAYYPFSQANFHISPQQLPVNVEGQVFDATRPTDNLGKYNFAYAPLTSVQGDSVVMFEMKAFCTLVKLSLTCPEPAVFDKLVISDVETGVAHRATYNLLSSQPRLEVNQEEFYETLDISLLNCETRTQGETLEMYLMLIPEDHRTGTFKVTLHSRSATYSGMIGNRTLEAGKAKAYSVMLERDEKDSQSDNQ